MADDDDDNESCQHTKTTDSVTWTDSGNTRYYVARKLCQDCPAVLGTDTWTGPKP